MPTATAAPAAREQIAGLFAVLDSPVCLQILDHYRYDQDTEAWPERSAKEMHQIVGLPLSNVSYHCKRLRGAGLLHVSRETPRRGAVERHLVITDLGAKALDLIEYTSDLLAD